MPCLRRHRRLLRTTLLVLLALGVLIQPVLGALGGLHDVEHAVAQQSDHGHPHHDGHEDPAGGDEASGDAVGAHALLHHGGCVASMALLEPASLLLSPGPGADPPTRASASGPRLARLTLPFRPPIA